ncbi:MAG: hypothetical protein ABSA42_00080 [Terracidiphilus sp.]|jgi:hypothetical protein
MSVFIAIFLSKPEYQPRFWRVSQGEGNDLRRHPPGYHPEALASRLPGKAQRESPEIRRSERMNSQ